MLNQSYATISRMVLPKMRLVIVAHTRRSLATWMSDFIILTTFKFNQKKRPLTNSFESIKGRFKRGTTFIRACFTTNTSTYGTNARYAGILMGTIQRLLQPIFETQLRGDPYQVVLTAFHQSAARWLTILIPFLITVFNLNLINV